MKKIFRKFWGVGLAVALLGTLMISTPTAQAAITGYYSPVASYANLPGGLIGGVAANLQNICANTTRINDFAVAGDGKTMYAATTTTAGGPFETTCGALKSTDGGRTWSQLFIENSFTFNTDRVAVAPDDPDIVAYLDITNKGVAVSINGGATFSVTSGILTSNLGGDAANVTAIAIAPKTTIEGNVVSIIAVTGSSTLHPHSAGAALYYYTLNSTGMFAIWRDAMSDAPIAGQNYNAVADTVFNAIAFTPSFAGNFIAYVIGNNAAHQANLHVVSFNNNQWDTGVASFSQYNAANCAIFANVTPAIAMPGHVITRSNIVFDPDYSLDDEMTRNACISFGFAGAELGYVIRLRDNAMPVFTLLSNNTMTGPTPTPAIWGLALNSDGSKLVAAAANSSTTWTLSNSLTVSSAMAIWTPSRTVKRSGGGSVTGVSGGDRMVIVYGAKGLFLSRAGNQEGAFALSTDDGYTFNDISLVRTTLSIIDDHAVATDGIKRYVVSHAGHTSVFYWDGTYWERVLTLFNNNGCIIKASPNNFNVVYLAEKPTGIILYSDTSGTVNWQARTSPVPVSSMADMEIQDDTILWVATNVAAGGAVTKLSNTGTIWPTGPPYYNVLYPGVNVNSITLVGPDKVIAGYNDGHIAYTNNGMTWDKSLLALPYANSVWGTAADLANGSIIYATTSNTSDQSVWTWTIGTSSQWGSPVNGPGTPVFSLGLGGNYSSQDIAIYSGCLYYIAANVNSTVIARALMPALNRPNIDEYGIIISGSPGVGITYASATRQPDVLKFSADPSSPGNKIWFTDAYGAGVPRLNQIITLTDVLAVTAPTLENKSGPLVQVNKQTGSAYNFTISWTRPDGALGYEVQISGDSAFNNIYADVLVMDNSNYPHVTVGPTGANITFNYQPGETFFFRVRVISPFYSQWSTAGSLNVQPIQASVPGLATPVIDGTVSVLKPGFSWSVMSGATEYHFQLATDANFTNIIQDSLVPGDVGAGVELTAPLVDGTQYFWHVQVSKPVVGDWSTVGNFIVRLPPPSTPPVTITQTSEPSIILTTTQTTTSITISVINIENAGDTSYIWAIIGIGAALVIAALVMILITIKSKSNQSKTK